MIRQLACGLVLIAIVGCNKNGSVEPNTPATADNNRTPRFEPLPEKIKTIDSTEYMVSEEPLYFYDSYGAKWNAPRGTKTDGASIPQFFLSFIGDRFAPEYRCAALIHDAYCQEINKDGPMYRTLPWMEVHLMFYDALLENRRAVAEKTNRQPDEVLSDLRAKSMFVAVWLRGPRWEGEEIRQPPAATDALQKEEFEKCRAWIEKMNPPVEQIVDWMKKREPALRDGVSPPIDW